MPYVRKPPGPTGLCLNHLDGMGQEESILKEYCERNVVFVKSVCLARILPRASVVVHDGSTFLSRFCMENNRPQIVLPVFGEGQTNASNVVNLGSPQWCPLPSSFWVMGALVK